MLRRTHPTNNLRIPQLRRVNTMTICDEYKKYVNTVRELDKFQMTIYQIKVNHNIEDRLIKKYHTEQMAEEEFDSMYHEYKNRIQTQCLMTVDWKENYSKIMYTAYKNTIKWKPQ
jgi:hypothetical protein